MERRHPCVAGPEGKTAEDYTTPIRREARTEPPAPKGVQAPTNQATGQIEKKGESGSHGAGNGPDEHISFPSFPGTVKQRRGRHGRREQRRGQCRYRQRGQREWTRVRWAWNRKWGRGGPVEARFSDVDGPRFVHHEPPEYPPGARRLGRGESRPRDHRSMKRVSRSGWT